MIKKNVFNAILTAGLLFGLTGCSLKDPFGIGYDTSSCEDSKNFGACGSPKSLYKNRDTVRQVQKDYLMSGLDQELFFAIDKEGKMLVKDDRDGKWELYETSKYKTEIDERNRSAKELIDEKEGKNSETNKKPSSGRTISPIANYQNDIPVTKETDLSIKYQEQGPLIVSRTKVGDIIRDNGLVQQVFVSNYVDYTNDLIASHEIYVVVKEPEWVVGEKTPKSVKVDNMPTPVSTNLLKSTEKTTAYQENVIDSYNNDQKEGVISSVINEPVKQMIENNEDVELINSFLNSK